MHEHLHLALLMCRHTIYIYISVIFYIFGVCMAWATGNLWKTFIKLWKMQQVAHRSCCMSQVLSLQPFGKIPVLRLDRGAGQVPTTKKHVCGGPNIKSMSSSLLPGSSDYSGSSNFSRPGQIDLLPLFGLAESRIGVGWLLAHCCRSPNVSFNYSAIFGQPVEPLRNVFWGPNSMWISIS